MIIKLLKFFTLAVLALALMLPSAGTSLAKKRSAADEQFFLQVLKICRFRETNFKYARINYEKRTFKCYGDRLRDRKGGGRN